MHKVRPNWVSKLRNVESSLCRKVQIRSKFAKNSGKKLKSKHNILQYELFNDSISQFTELQNSLRLKNHTKIMVVDPFLLPFRVIVAVEVGELIGCRLFRSWDSSACFNTNKM